MLYSEFLEGTKARDNEHNYHVYKTLEGLYMDSDTATKEDVYKAAKPFLNNEDTAEQKAIKAEIKKQIAESKNSIEFYNERISTNQGYINCFEMTKEELEQTKGYIQTYKKYIRRENRKIKRLEMILR